jgi:glutaredoxin 3
MKKIIIYSKDYCPYCIKAKNLLTSIGATYEEVDITATPEIIIELAKKSGMRTVPQIFLSDECLGGYDSIAAMHEKGELVGKLGITQKAQ